MEIQQGPSRSAPHAFSLVALYAIYKVDLVLFKDGSGAGFKVGKVKLHFEVHGLAFSIISMLAINKHEPATLWLFSLDLL